MYRIRFHGRGGQGIKTAGRILGSAFFIEGLEVQDAPRYGAERRGAPVFSYVRAARTKINERGIITNPDFIIAADESLLVVASAGVMLGAGHNTVLLVYTDEQPDVWKARLNFPGRLVALPPGEKTKGTGGLKYAGAVSAGAAARMVGVISRDALRQAINDELRPLGDQVAKDNIELALDAYDLAAGYVGCVNEGTEKSAEGYALPDWVDMPFEYAGLSAPAVYAADTSSGVRTGLWRIMRPVIDLKRCRRCWYICTTFCPDSAMSVDDAGYPVIDYDHCKGCLICARQCHNQAIMAVPETERQERGKM